jgi:hypothetical protein
MAFMTKKVVFAMILIALALLVCPARAASAPTLGSGVLLQMQPYSPATWIPFCAVVVMVVIIVAGIVYSISGIIGSTNAKNWSRVQVFEALLSLILIVAFGAFSSLLFINPQGAFSTLNLVPGYPLTGASNPHTDCTAATSVYQLATCDLSMFNNAGFALADTWYTLGYISGMLPGLQFKLQPDPMSPGITLSFSAPALIPLIDIPLLGFIYVATLTILLLQQLQLLIIAAAPLFLSVFITLGLVARTFGFTRTFGGAMIAFGLGLGLIYPLMICITYGYVDVHANVSCMLSTYGTVSPTCMHGGANEYSAVAILKAFEALILSSTGLTEQLTVTIAPTFEQLGYLLSGFTFVPFLDFIIVDAFIVDFSQAIGERMNFMGLLAGIV